jgi:hypothetical protein
LVPTNGKSIPRNRLRSGGWSRAVKRFAGIFKIGALLSKKPAEQKQPTKKLLWQK